jgi:hypothetical protein
MKIEFCNQTGLLFVNGVAIASDMIVHLHNIIIYDPQFNCNVTIIDKVNETSVAIGRDELIEIDNYISDNNLDLGDAKDFKRIQYYEINLN